jgi:hypothetical protein
MQRQRQIDYRRDAIIYNEMLATHARLLRSMVDHEEIKKWCDNAIKQHEIHADRHRKILDNLINKRMTNRVEQLKLELDSSETPLEEAGDPLVPSELTEKITEPDVKTTSSELTDENSALSDGCSPFHDPSNPNCEFAPQKKESTDA